MDSVAIFVASFVSLITSVFSVSAGGTYLVTVPVLILLGISPKTAVQNKIDLGLSSGLPSGDLWRFFQRRICDSFELCAPSAFSLEFPPSGLRDKGDEYLFFRNSLPYFLRRRAYRLFLRYSYGLCYVPGSIPWGKACHRKRRAAEWIRSMDL